MSSLKKKITQVTASVVYNSLLTGKGLSGVNSVCGVFGRKSMSSKTYYRYKDYVESLSEKKYKEVQGGVVKSIFEYYKKTNIHPDADGILNIDVIYDGTWMTRGHSSLIGVGVVAEANTGFILDAEVLCKYCQRCTYLNSQLCKSKVSKEIFQGKMKKHKESGLCTINFAETPGQMEAEAAVILWNRSLEKKLRYTVYVGDGDSSAFRKLIEGGGPYGSEYPVDKQECINHFAKRLGTRQRNLRERFTEQRKTKAGKIRYYKLLGGRGKLSDSTIGHMVRYMGSAVRRAKFYKENPTEMLRRDIMATLSHITSTDDKPDHDQCPKGEKSWCFFQKDLARGVKPRPHNRMKVKLNVTPEIKAHIVSIYDSLTSYDMLSRVIQGRTQNLNESFIGKIWNKCPKVKFQGLHTVKNGYYLTAAEHNSGYKSSCLVPAILGSPPGHAVKKMEKQRLRSSGRESSKKRKKRLQIARDPGYEPGAF